MKVIGWEGFLMDVSEIKRVFTLALRIGDMLIVNGATTMIVETTMAQIMERYGLPDCHPNVFPTSLSLSLDHPDLEYPLTEIRRIRHRNSNYDHLLVIFGLVDRIQRDNLSPEAALAALEGLKRLSFHDPLWLHLLSWAGACAASALLLQGNWTEIAACFLIVLPAQFCRQWIVKKKVPAPFGDLCAASVGTALVLGISTSHLTLNMDVVITASLYGLLPGAAIVTFTQELIEGDLLSSAARGLEAFLIGAAIAAGVGFVLDIWGHLSLAAQGQQAGITGWSWPWQILAACAASLCYGRALTVPRSLLLFAGLIGGCGWLLFLLIPEGRGQELFLATFLATFVVGCLGALFATFQRVPVLLYTLPGVFPFLPGGTLYQGMLAIAQGKSMNGLVLLVQAVAVGGTIAMGIALGSLIVDRLHRRIWVRRKE
jgi:uncharacterized membrane protein YjjP (DUF1212 family)